MSNPLYRPPGVIPPERQAPTLLQFWNSDSHDVPGRKPATWAGRFAFWLGLPAAALYLFDMGVLAGPGTLAAVALPISVVAFVFGLVAVIARVGRGLGIVGLILAIIGNIWAWTWLGQLLAG